jgi:hypothetical protein
MTAAEQQEFDLLRREVADLKNVLQGIKRFMSGCPNCDVMSKAIRDPGTSDYDVERMMRDVDGLTKH